MGSEAAVNNGKRRFLIGATSVVGGIGVIGAATPFVMSLFPSERAKAAGAPVEVDISKVESGMKINVEWRGKVCWVVNRTPEMLATLPKIDSTRRRPQFRTSPAAAVLQERDRSIKPAMWLPWASARTWAARPPTGRRWRPPISVPEWLGGFFCPCHQSKFDLAGRVFKGVPAPTNLVIPPHRYASDTEVVIGEDPKPRDPWSDR